MIGCKPRDKIRQWLDRDRHPEGVGVNDARGVEHHRDMAGEKDEVASSQRLLVGQSAPKRLALLIAVARRNDPGERQGKLDQSGTIDPAAATTAPKIGGTHQ